MTLYLDCEFNSFGGELISIALVDENLVQIFYRGCKFNTEPHPWVAENVIPILKTDLLPIPWVQADLESFLNQWPEVHIIADWPEDIAYFCHLVITGPGMRIRLPKLSFEIVTLDAPSTLPHNAMADAVGIRNAHVK